MPKTIGVLFSIKVCDNCTIAIANDDYSGMTDEESDSVRAGLTRLGKAGYP